MSEQSNDREQQRQSDEVVGQEQNGESLARAETARFASKLAAETTALAKQVATAENTIAVEGELDFPQLVQELGVTQRDLVPVPLKRQSKSGVYLWWSDDVPDWVHPDDHDIVASMVPGKRIFTRLECESPEDREQGYSLLRYGEIEFRALPTIWLEVETEGYEVGDLVEIKSRYGKLRPGIATIVDITWNQPRRCVQYFLAKNERRLARAFEFADIQPAIRLGHHLTPRQMKLAAQQRMM